MDLPDLPESQSGPPSASESARQDEEKRSFYQQLQVVTTFVTLIVAVTAIALSVWEGYETRLNNRLSVQPFLEGTNEIRRNDSTYSFTALVSSDGLGPAVYKKAMIFDRQADPERGPVAATTDDEPVISLGDATGLRERWAETGLPRQGFFGYFRQGTMQRPGDEKTFFSYNLDALETRADTTQTPYSRVREVLYTYSVVICYCSVYGDSCGQAHLLGPPASDKICADLGYDE